MKLRDGLKSYQILNVRVEAATIDQAVVAITSYAADGDSPAAFVIKPYVEFLDRANHDPEILRLLNAADLSLPDGVAVQWASHVLASGRRHWWQILASGLNLIVKPHSVQEPLPERTGGANFTWRLLEACKHKNLSVYLIGRPKGGAIENTAAAIHQKLPQLNIVGRFDGFAANNNETGLLSDLEQKRPDVILVGTGFPRQERFMVSAVKTCSHGVFIGEGGTFDYQSFGGRVRRAPVWMQRSGLEWLWRLFREPWRLRRQLAIPRFVWAVWRAANKLD